MAEVIQRYLADRTTENRNAVVIEFVNLAEAQSRRHAAKYPITAGELLSDCYVGLILAVETYKPDAGTQFRTWAIIKMRSAVLDGLRQRDHLNRYARGKRPEFKVVQMPESSDDYEGRRAGFEVQFTGHDDKKDIDADDLREAVSRGTTLECRTILRMAVAGHTNVEAGHEVGLSESRVSQIRTQFRENLIAADTWHRLTA